MVSNIERDFPYTVGLKDKFKSLLNQEDLFKKEQDALLETSVDFINTGSKYKLSLTLEAEGETQTIEIHCDDSLALSSEFRAIFHQYLGESAPLYDVVSKRFNEKVSEGALDVVTYLVMVDKDVYWNLLVTLSYLG